MNEQYNHDSSNPPAGPQMPNSPGGSPNSGTTPPPYQSNYSPDQNPQNSQGGSHSYPPAPGMPNDPKPYEGGIPIRCPRCGNVISTRFCSFCGMDLSAAYYVNNGNVYPNPPQAANGYNGQYMPPQSPGYGAQYVPPQTPPPYPPQAPDGYWPAKPHRHRVALVVCLLCVLFVVVFLVSGFFFRHFFGTPPIDHDGSYNAPQNESYYHPEGVSLTEYQELKPKMSYAKVSSIIGGDGQIVNQGEEVDGTPYVIYGWYGEDDPSVTVYITFEKDAATEITNQGLTDE